MAINHQAHRYQETEIKTATPIELVVLLYDAAIASLQKAQEHIAAREIERRTYCLNKAAAILSELQANLNFETGGTIAASLDRLYRYMKDRIFQSNLKQDAAPLKETVRLLAGLRSAWAEVSQTETRKNSQPAAEIRTASHAPSIPLAASGERLSPLATLNLSA
jgi:flagellar protein FliS